MINYNLILGHLFRLLNRSFKFLINQIILLKPQLLYLLLILLSACSIRVNKNPKHSSPTKLTLSLFKLLTNPTNNFEDLPHANFFTSRFTLKEIIALKLDTSKIDVNEYYVLSNERALKTNIPGCDINYFWRFAYGDQIEKIMRFEHNGLVKQKVVATSGWDAGEYHLSSEFINDSSFKETLLLKEETIDFLPGDKYKVDSIVTSYAFTNDFEFTQTKRDSFVVYRTVSSSGLNF